MRYMPTTIASDSFLGTPAVDLPMAQAGELERCLAYFCGTLSDKEREFVDHAIQHNWTIRVIVDSLLEQRGAPAIPFDFNWRTI